MDGGSEYTLQVVLHGGCSVRMMVDGGYTLPIHVQVDAMLRR
jgi:hypothetical protein